MVDRQDNDPVVLIGGGGSQNRNPLRMLELLMKGFCPTVMQDRVEVHAAEEHHFSSTPLKVWSDTNTSTPGCHHHSKVVMGKTRSANAGVEVRRANGTASEEGSHPSRERAPEPRQELESSDLTPSDNNNHVFEIGERPPSDVIGISKALWDGFCHHNDKDKGNASQQEQSTDHRRGFCGIPEHYRSLCPHHQDEDAKAPDGEECSVDTSSETASVDLSPQSSPQQSPRVIQVDAANYCNAVDYHIEDGNEDYPSFFDEEWALLSEIDEDEDYDDDDNDMEPMAEYYPDSNKRRNRSVQVLVCTVLAVVSTLALVQQDAGHGGNSLHFALERKAPPGTSAGAGLGFSSSISISKRLKEQMEAFPNVDDLVST